MRALYIPFQKIIYLEVHGKYEPSITALGTVLITILGHLRGLEVGCKYSHTWLISNMNLKVHPKP